MANKKSKSKIVITDKYRKKYGVCEHDQVSYKALDKMCSSLVATLQKTFTRHRPKR